MKEPATIETPEVKDENTPEVDKVSQIAHAKMAEINKEKESKEGSEKKEESKDASSESSPEKEKTEEKEPKKEEVKEPEKEEKPETEVDKIKKSTQARIDTLSGKLKAEENARKKDTEKMAELQKQIDDLKEVTKESEDDIYDRIVEEDKDLPIAKRREMSESDLEEFLLDDYSKATQWIIRRDMRREKDIEKATKTEETKKETKEFVEKTNDSMDVLVKKYPKIDVHERAQALIKEGKSEAEATKIMRSENKDFDMMMGIIESDNGKYSDPKTGPALVLAEMDKRMKPEEVKTYTAEEVESARKEGAEMEKQRRESIDEGSTSNFAGIPPVSSTDPGYQEGLKEFLKVSNKGKLGWTEKDYQDRLRYRSGINGVNALDKVDQNRYK